MKVPRQCHGSVMAVSWQTAMTLPWHCYDCRGTVMAVSWLLRLRSARLVLGLHLRRLRRLRRLRLRVLLQ